MNAKKVFQFVKLRDLFYCRCLGTGFPKKGARFLTSKNIANLLSHDKEGKIMKNIDFLEIWHLLWENLYLPVDQLSAEESGWQPSQDAGQAWQR